QIIAVAPIIEFEINPSTSRDDRCLSQVIPLDIFL
ncbi:abortive phage infection protein, partial [Brucella melitensis]|nr:abortive phage infection protein [Brucella melitensis]